MYQALATVAQRWLGGFHRTLFSRRPASGFAPAPLPVPPRAYQRLERVVLTDAVSRTLFEEFAEHRAGQRGTEETGWVLLGIRETSEAVVLATLPAGADRQAGRAHVRFNSNAQAVASRIVRQWDKRLTIVGVVHTHPGSLRHPSEGDYRGDIEWVSRLRGCGGVFAIGTADGVADANATVARQPRPHMQALGELNFSWYALAEGDQHYRPLDVHLTLGPDLARPLHSLWTTLEHHAEALDRLCRQQAGVSFAMTEGDYGSALEVNLPLLETGAALRLILEKKEAKYYLARGGKVLPLGTPADRIDRGVYLLLAEFADLE